MIHFEYVKFSQVCKKKKKKNDICKTTLNQSY